MKQSEKNQLSREKILGAAIEEFGARGYHGASLNALLSEHGLSKGLVYHYFTNRDQLYLSCAALCFDALTKALSGVARSGGGEAVLQAYFEARGRFFLEHPSYQRIFLEARIHPPAHLRAALAQVQAGFEAANRGLLQCVLGSLRLREGVSGEDALEYFTLVQSALQLRFAAPEHGGPDAAGYEAQARKMLHLLLYGLCGGEA